MEPSRLIFFFSSLVLHNLHVIIKALLCFCLFAAKTQYVVAVFKTWLKMLKTWLRKVRANGCPVFYNVITALEEVSNPDTGLWHSEARKFSMLTSRQLQNLQAAWHNSASNFLF